MKRTVDGPANRTLDGEIVGQIPKMILYKREVVGRDDDGTRVFDWSAFDEASVITHEQRMVDDGDEIVLVKMKVVALYPGELIDPLAISFSIDTDSEDDRIYRVMEYEQNTLRLILLGEAAV